MQHAAIQSSGDAPHEGSQRVGGFVVAHAALRHSSWRALLAYYVSQARSRRATQSAHCSDMPPRCGEKSATRRARAERALECGIIEC
ncbi:hypothetical protein BWU74_21570 [Paraburkholderia caledonica]|nr:hypothetical protein BWU74_21570 [Burkholderia sp. Bk]